MATRKKSERKSSLPQDVAAGGILKGLATLVERLGELAEAGEEIARTTEVQRGGREIKGVYGFSVKMGIGKEGSSFHVEPFGNVGKPDTAPAPSPSVPRKVKREAPVHEVREPIVDVFDEEKHTLVVVEMPGVAREDVSVEVEGDIVTIEAKRGTVRYRKEVLLPAPASKKKMSLSSSNGVFELKFRK